MNLTAVRKPAVERRPVARTVVQRSAAAVATPTPARALQNRVGNRAVQAVVAPSIQTAAIAARVSKPTDAAEMEAEAIARHVARMSQPAPATPSAKMFAPHGKTARPASALPSVGGESATPGPGATSAEQAAFMEDKSAAVAQAKAGAAEGSVPSRSRARGAGAPAGKQATLAKDKPAAGVHGKAAAAEGEPVGAKGIDVSSSEKLLQSLAAVPASSFSIALDTASTAVPNIQAREKVDLETAFPEVPRPSGLPRLSQKHKRVPTQLERGTSLEPTSAGARQGAPPETHHEAAEGPLPANQVSTAVAEPSGDDEGTWWDWLFNRVRSFLQALPTDDPGLNTSAGPRQQVDLSGEADPVQTAQNQQASGAEVSAGRTKADTVTVADFGENAIYPTVPEEMLRPSYKPAAPVGGHAGIVGKPPVLPGEARALFEENATPELSQKASEQLQQYRQEQAGYAKQSQATRDEGKRQIADQTERVRTEQEGVQQRARSDVDGQRKTWREENQKIQAQYAAQSDTKRLEIDGQIQAKVQTAEAEAGKTLTKAENLAEQERTKAEAKATQKKREAESKPQSWWDRVKGAVSDAFDAIKGAINDIFDALRKFVKEIIEAAKAVVRGIIEVARSVVVGLIKGFGEFLKGLVTIAFAAFPETAARVRAWIDDRVDGAVTAVNAAAKALKEATDAILDWIGKTLDAALAIVQAALNSILDVLKFLALGLVELMKLVAKLYDLIQKIGPMVEAIWNLIQDPTPVIEAIKTYIGGMIAQVPAMARDITRGGITFSEPPANHWEGIWRHLEPKLDYLAANWWTVIKQTLWHMVWPFAEGSPLWKDASDFWKTIKLAWADISAGNVSKAIDDILRIIQLTNNIIGLFYGWIALGLIIGFAIAGGVAAAPAGVVPGVIAGAGAGAAIAGQVGMGLAIATLAIEGAILAKAGYNLVFRSQNDDENESDYERVAGSGLTMAIIGAMLAIGWLAARVARAIIGAVFNRVFRRPALRGRGTVARGDIIEIRVALAARVLAILRGRTVTWLEAIRRNFPVIDLVEDGVINITARPKRAPLYRITGGRLISVKSSAQTGAALQGEINGWVGELATFNTRGNVSVVNPSGRTLVVALQAPVDAATEAALRAQAGARGVDLQLTTAVPPGHPAGVFPDQIPAIMAEAGVNVSNEIPEDTKEGEQPQPH